MLELLTKEGFTLDSSVKLRTFDGTLLDDMDTIKTYLATITTSKSAKLQPYKSFYYINHDNDYIKIKTSKHAVLSVYCYKHDPRYKRYFGLLTYDGSHYHGFQKQPSDPSIQETLEQILKHLCGHDVTIHASGRTDKGVHALEQPFHFDSSTNIPVQRLLKVINDMLPSDIKLLNLDEVLPVFHARYDALKKTYRYMIDLTDNPFNAHYQAKASNLNVDAFKERLNTFIGTHDFTNFSKQNHQGNSIRTIYTIDYLKSDESFTIEITGDGFLRYMVRMMIGAALHLDKNAIEKALDDPNTPVLKYVSEANGLYLKAVYYN